MGPLTVLSTTMNTDDQYRECNFDQLRVGVIATLIIQLAISLVIIFCKFIYQICTPKRPCTIEQLPYCSKRKIINPFCCKLKAENLLKCILHLGWVFLFISIIPVFASAFTSQVLNESEYNSFDIIVGGFAGIQYLLLLELSYQRLIETFKDSNLKK